MKTSSSRLFIAIPVTTAVRQLVTGVREALGHQPNVRWVSPDNLHITLKFLGDVEKRQLPAIVQACRDSATSHKEIHTGTTIPGAFPAWQNARVFWIGLQHDSIPRLQLLQQTIEQQLLPLGFTPEDRAFRPHLTIGRVKRGRNADPAADFLQNHTLQEMIFTVREIVLYRSSLGPEGPRYQALENFALQPGG